MPPARVFAGKMKARAISFIFPKILKTPNLTK
jgi:hypothetical protein